MSIDDGRAHWPAFLFIPPAAVLTAFAFASLLTGYDTTFVVSAVAALVCLGAKVLVDHRLEEPLR